MTSTPADGRRLRSERSRTAVIDAMLSFYDAGVVRPSGAEIAAASGVSERSVFRHFVDLEDLAASALERKLAEVMPWFADPPSGGPLAERIEALVDQRIALYDHIGNLARAAAYHAVSSPTVAQAVADRRALLRNQVARQFPAEFASLGKAERRRSLAALDQVLSLEAIDYLRSASGGRLGPRDLYVVLVATVTALLEAADRTTATTRTNIEELR